MKTTLMHNQLFILLIAVISQLFSGCTRDLQIGSKKDLQQLITSHNSDRQQRYYAIAVAMEKYPEQVGHWLGQGLINTPDVEVADHIIEKLAAIKTPETVIYLCRYAGKYPDREAEVRHICQEMSSQQFPNYIMDRLNSQEYRQHNTDIFEQLDLWQYLLSYSSPAFIVTWLKNIEPQNPFLETVCYYNNKFGYIPLTKGEMLQARQLYPEIRINKTLQARAKYLQEKDNYEFSIADNGLLTYLPDHLFQIDRQTLIKQIKSYLNNARYKKRSPAYVKAKNDVIDRFWQQTEKLNFTDLLRIKLLCEAIYTDSDFAPKLHSIYHNSEIGGLCFWHDNKLVLTEYSPGMKLGSHRYVESANLLKDTGNAIARWHIHDQINSGKEISGPGLDDMEYARQMGTNIIIVTALENSAEGCILFNYDLLTSRGRIIDLGCVYSKN